MDALTEPQVWIGFLTLAALEIVLGIDNLVFITILAGKLPAEVQSRARRLGLGLAVVTRVLLLLSLSWLIGLTTPLFSLVDREVAGRDLILLLGGLFLIAKSTFEIHDKLEGVGHDHVAPSRRASLTAIVVQIALLDIVFSLDSVITAVGMVDRIGVMIAAVIAAVAVMLIFADAVAGFVDRHPTVKMLALAFLLLIGFTLVLEGLHQHVNKGTIYFAMAFSLFVELVNIRARRVREPLTLHGGPSDGRPAAISGSRTERQSPSTRGS